MKTLSIGKYRGLQQCSTHDGAISVLALDHRQNLRKALKPADPEKVSDEEMMAFKQQVVACLAQQASAVLLDPEFGAAQCVATGSLAGETGLIVALDATGYAGEATARRSQVLPGWSVAKARRMGASAVKLLVYYHSQADSAQEIEALVAYIAQQCRDQDIPFFLEPLSYTLDPDQKKLPASERRRVVIETARRLTMPGVDILKAEFPLDIETEPDERAWAEACAELSAASQAPWVLLSASAGFDTYLRMVNVACLAGASGVAAGRAVWQEATTLAGQKRRQFLEQVARPRMRRLTALCSALARPWTDCYAPEETGADWYQQY